MKTQVCIRCGAGATPGDRFCTVCGAKIRRSASRPARPNPAKSRGKRRASTSRRKQRRWSIGPGALVLGGGLLLLLAGVLFILSQNRPAAPVVSDVPDVHDEQGIPYPDVLRLSLAEARSRYDAGTTIFVDVRSQGEYDTAHIPNAISLPLADLEARYRELPRDAEIATYCT